MGSRDRSRSPSRRMRDDRADHEDRSRRRHRREDEDRSPVYHRRHNSDYLEEPDGNEDRRRKDRRRERHRDKNEEHDRQRDHGSRRKSRDTDSRRGSDRRKGGEMDEDSDESLVDLRSLGVAEITDEDYFLKSAEFKYWLKEERDRYLDELSSESAHKYFRKFVRRWNDGALKEKYYRPPPAASSSARTAYKWSFASNRSRADPSDLAPTRKEVDRLTYDPGMSSGTRPSRPLDDEDDEDDDIGPSLEPRPGASRPLGPALPSASDRQLALESASEARKRERKADLREGYNRADEMVPRSGGKEGKMEEKRATNRVNRGFREKEVGGLEADEGTLMGDSSFQAALRARDAAKNRREDKRAVELADRRAATDERLADRRAKESATMDMFKALAKQRFG